MRLDCDDLRVVISNFELPDLLTASTYFRPSENPEKAFKTRESAVSIAGPADARTRVLLLLPRRRPWRISGRLNKRDLEFAFAGHARQNKKEEERAERSIPLGPG